MKYKLSIAIIILALIVIIVYMYKNNERNMILSGDYILTKVTPTIQTISKIAKVDNNVIGRNTLIRGKITKIAVIGNFIIGYLDMSYTDKDELTKYLGEYDKEGYFVINTSNNDIISGINEHELNRVIKNKANLDSGNIRFKPVQ